MTAVTGTGRGNRRAVARRRSLLPEQHAWGPARGGQQAAETRGGRMTAVTGTGRGNRLMSDLLRIYSDVGATKTCHWTARRGANSETTTRRPGGTSVRGPCARVSTGNGRRVRALVPTTNRQKVIGGAPATPPSASFSPSSSCKAERRIFFGS